MEIITPSHLGGHLNKTHIDIGILKYFYGIGCKSMLDIGCGPGGQVEEALKIGYSAFGVDGDPALNWKQSENFYRHDYQCGPFKLENKVFDLVWSCEFVEHVKPEFINNFMTTFEQADKYVAMTFAEPNSKKPENHKHFNEQYSDYWIDLFADYGFKYDKELTSTVKKLSTMKKPFFRKNGLVFTK